MSDTCVPGFFSISLKDCEDSDKERVLKGPHSGIAKFFCS
jgi:hypothetical protein